MIDRLKLVFVNAGKKRIVYFFVIIIIILLASLYLQKSKMEQQMELKIQFVEQKNILSNELDDLIDEHDDLLAEYGDLNEQLHDKDSLIQMQIAEIRNLMKTKNDLNEARRKIAALKDISKRYMANIDSLLRINGALTLEKDSVVKANKNINWKNYKLNKQNETLSEKVSKGSVLEIFGVDVKTIRYRNTGRELETKYAKKVQKIRTCFSVGANKISNAEIKIIYLQVIDGDGELVLGTDALTAITADSIYSCTSSSEFQYKNVEMTHCFEWERVQMLSTGTYQINLIIEGVIAAKTTLKLR